MVRAYGSTRARVCIRYMCEHGVYVCEPTRARLCVRYMCVHGVCVCEPTRARVCIQYMCERGCVGEGGACMYVHYSVCVQAYKCHVVVYEREGCECVRALQ